MTIGTPDVLLKLADTTGTVVVNSGSLGTNYALHGTNATRSSTNGLFTGSGKVTGADSGATTQTWLDVTGATGPGSGLDCINAAIAFKFTAGALQNSSCKLIMPSTGTSDGAIRVTLDAPTGTGIADLTVDFRHAGGQGTTPIVIQNIAQNTVYKVACSLDTTTSGAVVPKVKLNSATVVTGSTANFTSFGFENAWPLFLARVDFAGGAFGFIGEAYYFAYERGPAAWTSTDLDSINNDPTILFGGGGSSVVPRAQSTYRRRRSIV